MMPLDKEEGNYTDLAMYQLETSARDIADAKVLLDIGSYNNSASRSYYAVFHAISAIHALDKNAYKRHKDTIGHFNKDYINNGIFPREYGKKIIKAEKLRHNSDYGNFYVTTQEDAQEQLDFAIEFCDKVKEYFAKRLESSQETEA